MVHIVYTMDKNALKILQMNKTPWKINTVYIHYRLDKSHDENGSVFRLLRSSLLLLVDYLT